MILKKNTSFFIFFFLISAFSILKNVNLEDYWIDEMFSFFIADPSLDFLSTFNRHHNIEQIPITFNILLKYFYYFFGYDVYKGRFLVAFFGILNIFISYKIAITFKDHSKFYLFFVFLIAINIFLIKYSLELRPYSLLALTTNLSILFFFKYLNDERKLNYLNLILWTTITSLIHPFGLIVLFSYILFFLFNMNLVKKNQILPVALSFIMLTLFYLSYFINLNELTSWIPKLRLKFFTDFFFTKFFGSRILGIAHLITLIVLVVIFFKKVIKSKKLNFLIIILILAYLLPLIFAVIFKNILIDRYLIFIIMPILLLVSNLIALIKNSKVRFYLFAFLITITIGNFLTENVFRNLIFEKDLSKPNFDEAFLYIEENNKSKYQMYILPSAQDNLGEKKFFYEQVDRSLKNYVQKFVFYKNYKTNLINSINDNDYLNSTFWILCYKDIEFSKCKVPLEKDKFKAIIEKDLKFLKIIKMTKII